MLSDSLKKYHLTYDDAIRDTPHFRTGMVKFMEELEETQKWFELLTRACRISTEEYQKYNDTIVNVAKKLLLRPDSAFVDSGIVKTISESMITITNLQKKTQESLMNNIFGKNSNVTVLTCFREIREVKKQVDRCMERYDSSLSKYCAINKQKDPSSYTEVVHAYNENKKAYIHSCLDFIRKISILNGMVDPIISQQILPSLNDLHELYTENGQIVDGLIKSAKAFHGTWTERGGEYTNEALLDAYNKYKEQLNVILRKETGTISREPSIQTLKETTLYEKEGYLFRKVDQRWSRRYFSIQDFHLVSLNSQRAGSPTTDIISFPVLVCNTRTSTVEERRFCFELVTPNETLILQAESEKDMRAWCDAIDSAKVAAASLNEENDDELVEAESKAITPAMSDFQLTVTLDDTRPVKSTDALCIEEVVYEDINLSKKNQELHVLLKSVPATDYVIDVYSVGFQNEILTQGRIFLTQNRICFYSNILGFVNIVVIHFKDVVDVSKKAGTLQTSLCVATTTKSYNFKLYSKQERCYTVVTLIWKNVLSEEPVGVQQLIDSCHKQTKDSPISTKFADDKVSDKSTSELSTDYRFKVPDTVSIPHSEVLCGCKDHLEKQEVDITIPTSAKELFETMFGSLSKQMWETLDKEKGITNRKETDWSLDQLPARQTEFILPMNNPMIKAKEVEVKQTDTFIRKDEYFCYVVESRSSTPQVPFGDCFFSCTRYCITWISEDECRLVISVGIDFIKTTMMKSVIKSNAMKGLCDAAASQLDYLQAQFKGSENPDTNALFDVPDGISLPSDPIDCGCESHLEKIEQDIVVEASAKKVYEILFGSLSQSFWSENDSRVGISGRTDSGWQGNEKIMKFQIPMNNPMVKLKEADVNLILRKRMEREYLLYVIDSVANTPQVPYGDCFTTDTRYCISWVSHKSSRLRISNGVSFPKSTMMKSIIKSSCLKGSAEAANDMVGLLKEMIDRESGNTTKPLSNSTKSTVKDTSTSSSGNQKKFGIWAMLGGIVLILSLLWLSFNPNPEWVGAKSMLNLSKSPRMKKFITIQLQKEKSHDAHLNSKAGLDLIQKYQLLESARSDLAKTKEYLDEIEKHLIWTMYFEWNENELLKCVNNTRCQWSVPEI